MDISSLLDKNGNPSSRKLVPSVISELKAMTAWLNENASPAERLYCLHHKIMQRTGCKHCGNAVNFRSWNGGYLKYCSISCSTHYRPQKPKKEKPRLLTREEKIERQTRTNMERYGVAWAWMNKEGKEKRSKAVILNTAKTWINELQALGYTPQFSAEEFRGTRSWNLVTHDKCNTSFNVKKINWKTSKEILCPTCWTPRASKGQHDLAEWLRSLGVKVRVNDRKEFKGKMELDLYIPDHKLVIEYDGLYWHSEKGRPDIKEKSWLKFEQLKNAGLRSIMVFDYEWESKTEIVKSRIKNALGVVDRRLMARRCTIVELSSHEQKQFFELNHTQGSTACDMAFGLKHEDVLVAVMSFGKSRFNKKYEWELLRFATKTGTSVAGAASRLFGHWRKLNPSSSIISFSDNRWGTGNFYENLGFKNDGQTGQGYFYTNSNGVRRSRQQHMKHKLKKVLSTFNENLSERENCWNNGWYRVWDLGNTRWVIDRPS